MNEKTLIELIKAYGEAAYNHGGTAASGATIRTISDYAIKADELLDEIERRINLVRHLMVASMLVGDILDGKE